jgi:hypothetical protein
MATGGTGSQSTSEIYGYPVPDTWVQGSNITADMLNRNVRDSQLFLAYSPVTIVYRNALQSVASASQVKIIFDSEVVDIDNMFAAPSTDIIVARPGIYGIQLNMAYAGSSLGSIRSCHIGINGNWIASHNDAPAGNQTVTACSAVTPLNAGDIINAYVYQDSGAAMNIGGAASAPRIAARMLSTAATTLVYTPTGAPSSGGAKPPPSKPPTGHTPTKFVKTYYSTYSRSFISTGATRYDDPSTCYQGTYPGYGGNQRSIVGFNFAAIEADLAGATRMSAIFGFRPSHAYWNSGLTAVIGSHNYGSKPGSWSSGNVWQNQIRKGSCAADHNYTVNLTAWHCWAFQNGTITGMAFGPAPSNDLSYYGFMYGGTGGGRPYLQFTYYK